MAGCCLAITALGSSQLLYEFEIFDRHGEALHAAALATITGEPIAQPDGFAKVLDVALAGYSVVVFAALAATLGAYSSAKVDVARPDSLDYGTAHKKPSDPHLRSQTRQVSFDPSVVPMRVPGWLVAVRIASTAATPRLRPKSSGLRSVFIMIELMCFDRLRDEQRIRDCSVGLAFGHLCRHPVSP